MRASWLMVLAMTLPQLASAATVVTRTAGTIWQDGLFIGDGATGAMAYAPAGLEWVVNRNDVFDSRVARTTYETHESVMACVATNRGHSVAYLGPLERGRTEFPPNGGGELPFSLSAAILRIRFWPGTGWGMPAIPPAEQSLDTQTGELLTRLESPSMSSETLAFVERSREVMALEIGDRFNPHVHSVIELARPDDVRMESLAFEWRAQAGVVSFSQRLPGGETYAVALAAEGTVTPSPRAAKIATVGRQALFLAVRTTRDASDPQEAAIAAVQAARRDGLAAVRADNARWWRDFWTRGADVEFTSEPEVDAQWHYALYALASQFGSAPMPALNGLTFGPLDSANPGVGSHCYVHDQNVQIPLMPFFPLNHADFVRPFVKTYRDALPELRRRTREYFGAEGAYLPLNMNPNGVEHPIADYRYTLCGGAYSGLILAQAWWYSQDEAILREIYPLLKEFIRFYLSTKTCELKGGCHYLWSVPPEIFTGTRDDTATLACLKPCLEVAIEAAERFGVNAEECAQWREELAHYPKFARHPEGGWWCGSDVPTDHYMYGGHLFYPFFPAESDLDLGAAKGTLDYFWQYAKEVSYETDAPHPVHEWSAFYSGMAVTRLFGGERGWRAVKDFQAHYAKPNWLFSHNPIIVTDLTREQVRANLNRAPKLIRRNFRGELVTLERRGPNDLVFSPQAKRRVAPVLEGAAAFLMLSSEALCQSWGGKVRLFPSVPPHFTGKFRNFRVHGGRTVSAEMHDGKVISQRFEEMPSRREEP